MASPEWETRRKLLVVAADLKAINGHNAGYEDRLRRFYEAQQAHINARMRTEPIRQLLIDFTAKQDGLYLLRDAGWDDQIKSAVTEAVGV